MKDLKSPLAPLPPCRLPRPLLTPRLPLAVASAPALAFPALVDALLHVSRVPGRPFGANPMGFDSMLPRVPPHVAPLANALSDALSRPAPPSEVRRARAAVNGALAVFSADFRTAHAAALNQRESVARRRALT
ncbi:hypothetical protein F4679DRAFT_588464 [Xylaria curta]|nr:hypothetical protein F4679DRAFT_588464 [Xylaria curta]